MKDFKNQELRNLGLLINQQIEAAIATEGLVAQIEIDIIKENLRKLYDEVNYLNSFRSMNGGIQEENVANLEQKMDQEAEELMAVAEQEFQPKKKVVAEKVEEEPVAKVTEPKVIQKQEPKAKEVKKEKIEKETPSDNPKAESKPKSKTERKSLHELAREKASEKTIGEQFNNNAISSLKKHIGINDKFQFINELFNGKMKVYNECIRELDGLDNKEAAFKLVDEHAELQNWDTESTVYQQFMTYILRRF